MESPTETNGILIKSVVAVALVSSVAAAAVLILLRRPAIQSRRIIDRCDEALSELEHRAPAYS